MQPPSLGKTRIFVAEDDPATLELIITRLTRAGYDVPHARDGLAAVNGIIECKPDAAILDLNMPELDGFGVMRALRDRPYSAPAIPLMVLTARNAPDDVRRAVQLGARDFLSKPFKEVQLLERVARLLRPPLAAYRPTNARPPAYY
jgi:two-component system OmpR family response regulator